MQNEYGIWKQDRNSGLGSSFIHIRFSWWKIPYVSQIGKFKKIILDYTDQIPLNRLERDYVNNTFKR